MTYIARHLERFIRQDLEKKMVFISGPRQAGKTTLAQKLLKDEGSALTPSYLNWDSGPDRENIMREQFPPGSGMLVLDEVHKYSKWRQIVKGLYDKRHHELKILVTGSGRLDYYRHGGDSLQGRYHFYRLNPLCLDETGSSSQEDLVDLMRFGGFPEQYLEKSERESRRWSKEYRSRIVNEDLNSLEHIKDIALIEHLALRLPELVGSPLSLNALRQDLQVSHQSISRWIIMLENIYMIFRLYPFGSDKIRAVKKEAKHYHFDWTLIEDEALRFENLIACNLLKHCHFLQDYEGRNIELRYFRDIDKREVDFVIVENNRPLHFIECKIKGKETNPALKYLKERFPKAGAYQISLYRKEAFIDKHSIHVCPAVKYLNEILKKI